MSDNRNRKPRSYYVDYTRGDHSRCGFRGGRGGRCGGTSGSNNSRFRDTPELTYGNRGFLITSVQEVKSYLEMRNVFESYFQQLYDFSSVASSKTVAGDKMEETVEDELDAELQQLRRTRPFKQVKTQCKNSLFINIVKDFSYVDPVIMVDKFFNELREKREVKTSNTFKVLPILDTFRSSAACAKESISNLLQTAFKEEVGDLNYFIEFQSRGNYKLSPEEKQKIIEGIAEVVSELRPHWKVSRDNADYMIVLVALRNVCCLTLLKDYFQRCKYNVIEFSKDFVISSVQCHKKNLEDEMQHKERQNVNDEDINNTTQTNQNIDH